jgi:hypothetical protein
MHVTHFPSDLTKNLTEGLSERECSLEGQLKL